ncbi:MAG: histidine--tRNA ligase [Candidatus Eisenbacteria bacterium]|uniref:Histidine--tRNA ligase n=1 Tax=Eiseniibacteriota bacterium TaxID=2212470 RepID=A0A849SGL8_UNCEI|nr:histidine--tRNA ligase [Candidatus Eisenbacteria bacterium]
MAPRHQAPRGTRDLLPGDIERWQWAEARSRGVMERYGYREIRTPLFEDYELFARTSGDSSDVVQKEMYRFKDLGDRDLALRPENTAGVCRAYLEHGLASKGRVHRLWYAGPMFRYGRPQKGRYRQFWQIGAEVIGTPAPGADVEMIALFVDIFDAWGITGLTVAVNSVGTPESRRAYGDALREWLAPVRDRLGADSQRRLETNPLRVLDTKVPDEIALLRGDGWPEPSGVARPSAWPPPMPHLIDVLDPESRAHFDAVRHGLETLGIAYEVDHGLVRGLDYYTRTAFEVHDRSLGAQSALGGGGRYDGLIQELGGPATPGVGFSIGLDRSLLVMEERGLGPTGGAVQVYVAAMDTTRDPAAVLARTLRRSYAVELDPEARGLSAQMKAADKSGARLLVLVGEEEWAKGGVVVRDLRGGEQEFVMKDRIEDTLRARLGATNHGAQG